MKSTMYAEAERKQVCSFEYIYFARPDSIMDGQDVYQARLAMGREMWNETHYDADLVISVPDSGTTAALGYSMASGIPFNFGLIKNRYMGRTFIKPDQKQRELAVRMKLNVVKSVVKGKRIVMVDDSIVRRAVLFADCCVKPVLKKCICAYRHRLLNTPVSTVSIRRFARNSLPPTCRLKRFASI